MLMYYDATEPRGYSYNFNVDTHNDVNMELIQIDEDRYNGAYSDHTYTAWMGARPDGISDPDPTCQAFWDKWKDKAIYGGGETPQEAYLDLVKKHDDLGLMVEDDGNCRSLLLVITLHQYSAPNVGFVYRSDEFREWLKQRTKKAHRNIII